MELRPLGSTGFTVGELGLGCEGFLGKSAAEIGALLDLLTAAGGSAIDLYSPDPQMRRSLGAALAGVAGACLMSFYYVFPSVGDTYGTRSFIVVTIGGLGNTVGAFIGGIVLGLLETVGSVVVGSSFKDTVVYVAFVLILVIKNRIQARRKS